MEDNLMDYIIDYLGDDKPKGKDVMALEMCIKRAINLYKTKRNFPSSYNEDKINSDMVNNFFCLFDLSLYFYLKIGSEYESLHIENTVHRTYSNESDIFVSHGVFPFAGSLI